MATKVSDTFVKLKNPYTFGVPVSDQGKFFGREAELQRIFDTLETVPRGQKQDIVVLGPRRIGKSSLLRRLVQLLNEANRDFVPVYIDVQNILPRETYALFAKILQSVKKAYRHRGITLPDFDSLQPKSIPPGFEFLTFNEDMESLNETIGRENLPRLVLMFDEVELLLDFGGIEILEWLRSLIQSMTFSVFVVAGSDRLYTLTQDYGSPFYNIFKTIELFPLDPHAAKELIIVPAARVGMKIYDSEVKKILSYSGNNPYFIQGIAHYLVEELNKEERYQVYAEDVDKVIIECIRYLSPQFGYYWNAVSQQQRIILYALARIGYPLSTRDLISRLHLIRSLLPSRQELSENLGSLVQQQILQEDSSRYWFVVPLFVDWILSRIDDEEIIEIANALREGEGEDYGPVRRLLTISFTDEELQDLILTNFRPVVRDVSSGISKGQVIEQLVKYAAKNSQIDKLVTQVKNRHPQQFAVFDAIVGLPVTDRALGPIGYEEPEIDLVRLHNLLPDHFTEMELRTLASDLSVDYDFLGGESKSAKAAKLVEYIHRHGRLNDMLETLQKMRPRVDWQRGTEEPAQINRSKLYEAILNSFNADELSILTFDLGISYESLPGEAFTTKVQALILYMDQHGRLDDLVEHLRQSRPHIKWEDGEDLHEFDAHALLNLLDNYFSSEDLFNLAFMLGIDLENLPGSTRRTKAVELVSFLNRRGRLDDLIKVGSGVRPDIDWPNLVF